MRSLFWCSTRYGLVGSFGVSHDPFFCVTEVGKQDLPRTLRHMAGSAPVAKGAPVHRKSGAVRNHPSHGIRSRHRVARRPASSCTQPSGFLQRLSTKQGMYQGRESRVSHAARLWPWVALQVRDGIQVGCFPHRSSLRPDFGCPAIHPLRKLRLRGYILLTQILCLCPLPYHLEPSQFVLELD